MKSSYLQGALTRQGSRADANHVLMCSLLYHALSLCIITGSVTNHIFYIANYTAFLFKLFGKYIRWWVS